MFRLPHCESPRFAEDCCLETGNIDRGEFNPTPNLIIATGHFFLWCHHHVFPPIYSNFSAYDLRSLSIHAGPRAISGVPKYNITEGLYTYIYEYIIQLFVLDVFLFLSQSTPQGTARFIYMNIRSKDVSLLMTYMYPRTLADDPLQVTSVC